MTTVLAQFKIQPGKEAEAEKALNEMAAAVEANEPGALLYVFNRSQKEPSEITVFEVYADGDGKFELRGLPRAPVTLVAEHEEASSGLVELDLGESGEHRRTERGRLDFHSPQRFAPGQVSQHLK